MPRSSLFAMTTTTLAGRIAERLTLAVVAALLIAAAPSVVDGWHDGGPVGAVLRLGFVIANITSDVLAALR